MILMALSKTTFGQINYALMPNGGRPNTNGDENTQFQYALDVENINQKNGGSYAPPVTPTANTCWSCKENGLTVTSFRMAVNAKMIIFKHKKGCWKLWRLFTKR